MVRPQGKLVQVPAHHHTPQVTMSTPEETFLNPERIQEEARRSLESYSPSGLVSMPDAANTHAQFHATLERLLRTATAQLSDIAVLYAMSAKANSQSNFQDPGGIFSPANVQPPEEEVPIAISKDPTTEPKAPKQRRQRHTRMRAIVSPDTDTDPNVLTSLLDEPNKKRKRRRDFDSVSSSNPRQDPAYLDLKICPDCNRRGNGSRSQSGLIYYYCRNAGCPGRGSSPNKFIGWSKS
eukprot:Protomagalhaensia_wolfi_Nauph_80__296@NODE_1164_length_1687_cov_327_641990_g888_i0_p1_GENE_NODE_1164_length_1687_cov_327_641990_g888_i0NODE_1164_length_1687_cov_327_641990_g888_i0_p1_ORF_typecomplete_len237_score38_09Zn_ribbon_recom/PF13408_6/0_04_NODE_1164_length_1687_cov_327_641990_g888_i0177887